MWFVLRLNSCLVDMLRMPLKGTLVCFIKWLAKWLSVCHHASRFAIKIRLHTSSAAVLPLPKKPTLQRHVNEPVVVVLLSAGQAIHTPPATEYVFRGHATTK